MKVHYREDNIYDKIHRVVESSAQMVDTIELNYQEMEEFKDSYNYVIIHDEVGDFSHYEYRGIKIVDQYD